jgi:hypothetical protein
VGMFREVKNLRGGRGKWSTVVDEKEKECCVTICDDRAERFCRHVERCVSVSVFVFVYISYSSLLKGVCLCLSLCLFTSVIPVIQSSTHTSISHTYSNI